MDIQIFLNRLFERASGEGFEAFEAYYTTGSQFDVGVFGGEIVEYNVSGTLGLSFRALVNGKMGYASTQVLDEDALEMLILTARSENAQLIENEDEQFIFGGAESYPALNLYNPGGRGAVRGAQDRNGASAGKGGAGDRPARFEPGAAVRADVG